MRPTLRNILILIPALLITTSAHATSATGLFATLVNNATASVQGILGALALMGIMFCVYGGLTSKGQGFMASAFTVTAIGAVGALAPTILGWVGISSSVL